MRRKFWCGFAEGTVPGPTFLQLCMLSLVFILCTDTACHRWVFWGRADRSMMSIDPPEHLTVKDYSRVFRGTNFFLLELKVNFDWTLELELIDCILLNFIEFGTCSVDSDVKAECEGSVFSLLFCFFFCIPLIWSMVVCCFGRLCRRARRRNHKKTICFEFFILSTLYCRLTPRSAV